MKASAIVHSVIGLLLLIKHPQPRGERGLSQSAEIALLLAAAATVAILLGTFIKGYVESKLPK